MWCITGGSPCQDLSIAGKRAGLAGARSGLFMEQVRIVKEMREADKRAGRTGDMVRPRYLVWENVVGAFSSNKGKDFAAVLEEIIKIVEPEAPGIEVPEKGWPTWGGYHDEVGGRWSVVWRTHDAQYWGVPQRRRRISVVADFGGDTAAEVQFDRKSLSRDIAAGGAPGERFAEAAEIGADPAIGDCMTAWDCQSKRIFDTNGKSPTLQGGVGGGVNNPAIFCMATQQGGAELRTDDRAPTLTAAAGMSGNNQPVVCAGFKAGQGARAGGIGYSEEVSPTLAAMPSGTNQTPEIIAPTAYSFDSLASNSMKSKNPHSGCRKVEIAKTLDTTDPTPSKNQGGIAVVAPAVALDMTHACDVIGECGEHAPTLSARAGTGGNQVPLTYGIGNGQANEASIMAEEVSQTLNTMHDAQAVMCPDMVQNMVVRRLTPLECTRLQGYPDGWVGIGDWTDEKGKKHKDADSPKYKALGNSIALPFWEWMLRRMARYLPEGATLGSLFDGIGGFPLIFERIHGKGTARWASEIEPFPIAVTKKHFPEEA